jgi:hypothetical protein
VCGRVHTHAPDIHTHAHIHTYIHTYIYAYTYIHSHPSPLSHQQSTYNIEVYQLMSDNKRAREPEHPERIIRTRVIQAHGIARQQVGEPPNGVCHETRRNVDEQRCQPVPLYIHKTYAYVSVYVSVCECVCVCVYVCMRGV